MSIFSIGTAMTWLKADDEDSGAVTVTVSEAQEVVLEVPRKLIEDWKRENPEQKLTDQAIAADIARVVVADAMSSFPDLPVYELASRRGLRNGIQ
jgi:hypothetical protein